MKKISLHKITLLILLAVVQVGCQTRQESNQMKLKSLMSDIKKMDFKLPRPLQVGDKIELSGGYDYDPLFLKHPPASRRSGTVVQFIKGQNGSPAAVVKLDEIISGEKTTGDIVVLELRYAGQTWKEPTPVHIELCDFMPEDKAWKDRKQGEWIEAAATVTLVQKKE